MADISFIKLIPVNRILPSRYQTRKDFNEESLKSLAESIKNEGLEQAVMVRLIPAPNPLPPGFTSPDGEWYELIFGERRLRAHRLAGLDMIEAKVVEVVSEATAAAKATVENSQKSELNPIEEAENFDTLNRLDPSYWTHDRIASIAGVSREYVTKSIGMLKMSETVKNNVRRRTLSRSHALEIARLTDSPIQEEAANTIIAGDLNRASTRKLIDKMLLAQQGQVIPTDEVLSPSPHVLGEGEDEGDAAATTVFTSFSSLPGLTNRFIQAIAKRKDFAVDTKVSASEFQVTGTGPTAGTSLATSHPGEKTGDEGGRALNAGASKVGATQPIPSGMEVRETPRGATLNLSIDIKHDHLPDIYRKAQFLADTGKELKTIADTLSKQTRKTPNSKRIQLSNPKRANNSPKPQELSSTSAQVVDPAAQVSSASPASGSAPGDKGVNAPAAESIEEFIDHANKQKIDMLHTFKDMLKTPEGRAQLEPVAKANGFQTPEEFIAKMEKDLRDQGLL